jgi:hypothetical protein
VDNRSEFSGALSTSTYLSIGEKSYAEDQSQMSNMISVHANQFAGNSRWVIFVGILHYGESPSVGILEPVGVADRILTCNSGMYM